MFKIILSALLCFYLIYLISSEKEPDHRSSLYSKHDAILMTEFADIAYIASIDNETFWNKIETLQKKRHISLENIRPFYASNVGIVGFTAESSREILIGVSGTQISLPKTIEEDLDQDLVRFLTGKGFVCHGFLKSLRGVLPVIWDRIAYKKYTKIWMVGHSLGGAIVTLGSALLKEMYPDAQIITYTFGSPPVGDYEFSQMYDSLDIRSFRIQNTLDIIPRLTFLRDYKHVSTLILIHQSFNETLCQYDSLPPQDHPYYNPLHWWENHSLKTYRNLLISCT